MMLGYPSFSHLLDLRQQQHHHHQRYSAPSPPVTTTATSGKSFTIDAILGLGDKTPLGNHQADKQPQPHGGEASGKKTTKSKRVRTIFTPEQLERLEAEFERQQYMVGPERLYLAHALQLTEAQVKVWFQNRRIKWRKQHLELQQQRLAALKHQQQLQHQQLHGEDMDDSEVDSNSGDETGGFAPQNAD